MTMIIMKYIVNNIGAEGAKMISEGLKSNSTLTELDLSCDEKEEKENKNEKTVINEINREQYWRFRSKDDK